MIETPVRDQRLSELVAGDVLIHKSTHRQVLPLLEPEPWALAERHHEEIVEGLARYGIVAGHKGQKVTPLSDGSLEIEVRVEVISVPDELEQPVALAGVPLWTVLAIAGGIVASIFVYNLTEPLEEVSTIIETAGGGETIRSGLELGKLIAAAALVAALVWLARKGAA